MEKDLPHTKKESDLLKEYEKHPGLDGFFDKMQRKTGVSIEEAESLDDYTEKIFSKSSTAFLKKHRGQAGLDDWEAIIESELKKRGEI